MKGSVFVAAAAAAGVSASAHRQAHAVFKRGYEAETCVPGCQTIYTTIYGQPTLVPNPPSPKTSSAPPPPPPAPEKPTSTYVPDVDLPTNVPELCPTPGEYEFPATTITVSETTVICAPETTEVPEGTQTYGGITTVVEHETTITCPYPTEKTEAGVVTSVIETTTYVCPEAGTYTIAPTTTVCEQDTTLVYPTITTVVPGTYTRPAVTTTVTEENVIVVCPWTSEAPAPPAPTTVVEQPTSKPQPPKEEKPQPKPSPKPSPQPPKEDKPEPSPQPPKGGNLGGGEGDHWAMTYTPYREDSSGTCKSSSEVDQDIQTIKKAGFSTVRIYSTDCDTLENVAPACEKYGLKMIIGVFVKDTCNPNAQDIKEQVDAITKWKQWGMVELLVVGNEAIFQGLCDASSLKTLIQSVKSSVSSAGYDGPVTTAETLGVWEQSDVSSQLCGSVDIVGGQIHPYFNAEVAPSEAGKFVKNQLDILGNICSGKSALNLECGWPSGGNANGKARPGQKEQAEAIASIKKEVGAKTVFFSFHNDPWKEPGECGCEQKWGCGTLF